MTLKIERAMKRKINEVLDDDQHQFREIKKHHLNNATESISPVAKETEQFWGSYFDQTLEKEWNELQDDILNELAEEIDDFLEKDITTKLKKMSIDSKNNTKSDQNHGDEDDLKPFNYYGETKSITEIKASRQQGRRRRTYAICCNDSTDTEDETSENSLEIK